MPIYEYECSYCKQIIEIIQRFTDKRKTKCPLCEQESLNKIISMTNFDLKGNGFHKNDYE